MRGLSPLNCSWTSSRLCVEGGKVLCTKVFPTGQSGAGGQTECHYWKENRKPFQLRVLNLMFVLVSERNASHLYYDDRFFGEVYDVINIYYHKSRVVETPSQHNWQALSGTVPPCARPIEPHVRHNTLIHRCFLFRLNEWYAAKPAASWISSITKSDTRRYLSAIVLYCSGLGISMLSRHSD
jgi:hypothetical protein